MRRAVIALNAATRRDALDAHRGRGRARAERDSHTAPAAASPTGRARRRRSTHHLRHARLSDEGARREDRHPDSGLRQERRRRSEARDRIRRSISTPASSASTPRRSSSATSSSSAPRTGPADRAADDAQREGVRARLRRAHRQAAVDLPHDPAARRVRLRHVAGGLRRIQRQHRRLGADERRRRSWVWSTCPSKCRPATTTAAIGPANKLFADSLVALDVKTGSASGTTRPCITTSGTGTWRARRCCST